MDDTMIKVEGLGKKYVISHQQQAGSYTALRDVISEKTKSIFQRGKPKNKTEEFWALKDVNFEIKRGEAVGIIGRNGAGKSTLLKLLSRITEPSQGRIELNGRIASLLEVGTGFHPELSGRENIFLNGAILGMTRMEIKNKFDEIVDFSGVERFLDTPVKRYSSGMYVRLAFAVAAHLEPEILVVDEVLAVGDAEFQRKCLGKMEEVSTKEGRTILFVSHQLSAIRNFCTKGIFLANGGVEYSGEINDTIEQYALKKEEIFNSEYHNNSISFQNFFFQRIYCDRNTINAGEDIAVFIEFSKAFLKKEIVINITIHDIYGDLVAHIINDDDNFSSKNSSDGKIQIRLKNLNLAIGKYTLSFWAGYDHSLSIESLPKILNFEVEHLGDFIQRKVGYPINAKIIFQSKWNNL